MVSFANCCGSGASITMITSGGLSPLLKIRFLQVAISKITALKKPYTYNSSELAITKS